jgi:transposase-like protein
MPPRKSYTAAFKLEAVAYAKENGNRATSHHFSINEKMVRNWRKQEDELRLTKNLNVQTVARKLDGLHYKTKSRL